MMRAMSGRVLAVGLFTLAIHPVPPAGPPGQAATTVILLGTGMPRPDPAHQGPATVVLYGDRVFLFDAGPGVERQMAAAGLPVSGPEAVFITHLHSDHTLGYPDLILTSWVLRRTTPLQAYGPPGLRAMTDHLLEAYAEDIDIRINGLEHETPDGYRVDVHQIAAGVVYEKDGVKVTAIPVLHGSWRYAFGYRVDTPDRSVVISGDTRPSDALMDAARGVDVLVHEVYPHARIVPEDRPGGEDWPEYMKQFHTSDLELGALAARAQPKLLVLTHIVYRGGSPEEVVQGIRAGGFAGPIEVGRDLGRY
jgi:ribonuclease BN (tRNA processing enzyme)